MSVARSARKTSSCQYVVTAGEVDSLISQLAIKLPKRWDATRKSMLLETSDKLLSECVSANAIWTTNQEEHRMRLCHLTEAYCACAVLQVRIDRIASERPTKRFDQTDENGETVHIEQPCVSDGFLKVLCLTVDKEQSLIKGALRHEREKQRLC
jgi:hypothetical protein